MKFKTLILLFAVALCIQNRPAAAGDIILWKFETDKAVYASPVIHNNVLYIGSLDKTFYALNAQTGEQLWQFITDSQIRSTAAIDNGVICFESDNILYGLDLEGKLIWQTPLYTEKVTTQFDSWDYYHSSPNIVNGTAYICTQNGLVFGIDVQSGDTVFQCQTDDQKNIIRTTPAVYNEKIYFGDWNGMFYVYDTNSGEPVWTYDVFPERLWTGGPPAIQTSPLIFNDAVYFAGRGCILYSLNAETGAVNWKHLSPTNEWIVGGPSIDDSQAEPTLYIGSSNQHILHAFNANTGTLKWKTGVDYRVWTTPLILDSYVFIGSNSFYAIDKMSGDIKKRLQTGGEIISAPVEYDGRLYFGCSNGTIYCVHTDNFTETPSPNTLIRGDEEIDLGDVPQNQNLRREFYVVNKGDGADSVWINLSGATSLTKTISVQPDHFNLAEHDSLLITVEVDLSQLRIKKYQLTVKAESMLNLEKNELARILTFSVVEPTTGGSNDISIPGAFSLNQNYPNPFNPETRITYSIPRASDVSIRIYNHLGQPISTLIEGRQSAGKHLVMFDGSSLGSGIYLCVIQADEFKNAIKMILNK